MNKSKNIKFSYRFATCFVGRSLLVLQVPTQTAFTLLSPWCRIFNEWLIVAQLIKKIMAFMDAEELMSCSQLPSHQTSSYVSLIQCTPILMSCSQVPSHQSLTLCQFDPMHTNINKHAF
jgi:hypothetical protein